MNSKSMIFALLGFWLLAFPFSRLANANETIRVQLRWHHQFQFAGYYAAIAQGYYQQRGLEVELVPIAKGKSPMEEVLSGNAQFSQGDMGLMVNRSQGQPLVVLAATFQHSPSVFLTLASSNIRSPKDFVGKRVMMFPGYNNLVLYSLLRQFDVQDKFERLDSSAELQDLIRGDIDVFNAYSSNEPFVLEEFDIPYNQIKPSDYGIEFYGDVIFTSQDFLQKNTNQVEKFVEATLLGWRYAMANPEEIIELIVNQYQAPKSKSHLRFEANMLRAAMMSDLLPIGTMNRERWQNAYAMTKKMNIVDKEMDWSEFIYDIQERQLQRERIKFGVAIGIAFAVLASLLAYYLRRNIRLANDVKQEEQAKNKALDLALHDPLTQLPNRLLFREKLQWILNRRARENTQPLFLFLDLDNFKQVNDRHGHDAGDILLREVANTLAFITRANDTCARIAGDEFIILIENCLSMDEAQIISERTLKSILKTLNDKDPTNVVSVSIGVLIIDKEIAEKEAYKLADQLMYQAKRSDTRIVIKRLSQILA